MRFAKIGMFIHLGVQGNHHASRPVIVDDQIVNAADLGIRKNGFANLLHKFLFRRLAEQGAYRIARGVKAGI